jgi:hypothetical protein
MFYPQWLDTNVTDICKFIKITFVKRNFDVFNCSTSLLFCRSAVVTDILRLEGGRKPWEMSQNDIDKKSTLRVSDYDTQEKIMTCFSMANLLLVNFSLISVRKSLVLVNFVIQYLCMKFRFVFWDVNLNFKLTAVRTWNLTQYLCRWCV